jgi:stearoyl-CoA desaturase (delta-9 desaturase)
VHRKHHSFSDVPGDPHSPVVFGIRKVLWQGAELYAEEICKPETLEKYGRGTPDDWVERNVYSRYKNLGILLMVIADLLLFGVPGIIIIAVQMISMPLMAAGVINGLGHPSGYRNFECEDQARNIVPWGLLVGGEELHNNHHAFPASAKFSARSWEFDIGWFYIRIFEAVGLARVHRIAPEPARVTPRRTVDLENLRAVIVNRMHVLRHYTNNVTLPVLRRELEHLGDNANSVLAAARRLLAWQPENLDASSRQKLADLIARYPPLKTVLEYRNGLKNLWEGANQSNERLLAEFRRWCAEADASGNLYLEDFVAYLKSFRAMPEPAAS